MDEEEYDEYLRQVAGLQDHDHDDSLWEQLRDFDDPHKPLVPGCYRKNPAPTT